MPIRAGIAGAPRQVQCGNVHRQKLIPMIASATAPAYVDIDPDGGRVHFATKWSPTLVVFHIKTEHVLRYVELGVFGPGYRVASTPDNKRLYIPLGVPAQSAVPVVDAKTLTIPISSALKLASQFRSRSQARSNSFELRVRYTVEDLEKHGGGR